MTIPNAGLLGLLLALLGLGVIVGAPKQAIEVMNSGGGLIVFPVSAFERGRTLDFAGRVSEAIARSSRGGRVADEASPPSVGGTDPSRALLDLQRLRDQGLVTEREYSAKRAEILSRL